MMEIPENNEGVLGKLEEQKVGNFAERETGKGRGKVFYGVVESVIWKTNGWGWGGFGGRRDLFGKGEMAVRGVFEGCHCVSACLFCLFCVV